MTDQNVKLAYNPDTNYRVAENLANLSLRGLMDLLTALGSDEAQKLQNDYKRDTRTLRTELTSRIQGIFDADSSFSFDEDENETIAVSEDLAEQLVTQSTQVEAEVDSDEDPLMSKILDLASDSTTEQDAMDFVTEQIDSMNRAALIEHAEKYVQVAAEFADLSTHEMRQTLIEHYAGVQESLADDEDDEELSESLSVDVDDSNFESDEDFNPDTEEDPDSDSEFESEESEEEVEEEVEEEEFESDSADDAEQFDHSEESEHATLVDDEDDLDYDDQNDQEEMSEEDYDALSMDRIEESDYLLHSDLPHSELSTVSRLLVKLHSESSEISIVSEDKAALESANSDGVDYDMRTPLRSASAAERNNRNVGWFAECMPAIARVLTEFNSVNRTYVGDVRSLQRTIHTIQYNLTTALNAVVLNTVGAIELPEGMDISNFYQIDIQPNTLEKDTEVTFDVVLNLLVPMLADLIPAKFEQAVNTIASQINKATQNVAEDTESFLEVSVHFAASMETVIDDEAVRLFFADNPHYTANKLYLIAKDSEEAFANEFNQLDEDDTDESVEEETFDVNEEVDSESEEVDSEESDSILLDLCSTFSGLAIATNWMANIISDDLL